MMAKLIYSVFWGDRQSVDLCHVFTACLRSRVQPLLLLYFQESILWAKSILPLAAHSTLNLLLLIHFQASHLVNELVKFTFLIVDL